MSDFIAGVLAVLLAVVLVFVFAALGGTVVWLLWPIAIPAVFPGLVASGVLAGKLSWWAAVTFTWLVGLLIKSSTSVTKKENK